MEIKKIIRKIITQTLANCIGDIQSLFPIGGSLKEDLYDISLTIVDLVNNSSEDSYGYTDYCYELIVKYNNDYLKVTISHSSYTEPYVDDNIEFVKPKVRTITDWVRLNK